MSESKVTVSCHSLAFIIGHKVQISRFKVNMIIHNKTIQIKNCELFSFIRVGTLKGKKYEIFLQLTYKSLYLIHVLVITL